MVKIVAAGGAVMLSSSLIKPTLKKKGKKTIPRAPDSRLEPPVLILVLVLVLLILVLGLVGLILVPSLVFISRGCCCCRLVVVNREGGGDG